MASDEIGARTIVLVGALDTKGEEFALVRRLIESSGLRTILVDFGVFETDSAAADITAAEVARAGGGEVLDLRRSRDKGIAMKVMAAGVAAIVRQLYRDRRLDGILAMGGTSGTSVAAEAMRTLPLGIPKLIVSTVASGDVSPYVGTRDISMMASVVDVAGVNRISHLIYTNAAAAIAGMVSQARQPFVSDRPLIAASMFGNTTPCVDRIRISLAEKGHEVLVFHSTGTGGRTIASLVAEGALDGLLDVTPTELADAVCGGVFSAGRERVNIAADHPIPVVIAPGCVDMCNFGAMETVPSRYSRRNLYQWNSGVTLMRTDAGENAEIGRLIAETANRCKGPCAVLVPLKGVSMLDAPCGPFWDPEADQACFTAIRENLRPGIPYHEHQANVNDPLFADSLAETLLSFVRKRS